MSETEINEKFLIKLSEALSLLGIKPRLAGDWASSRLLEESIESEIDGLIRENLNGTQLLTPRGAGVLMKLWAQGDFEEFQKKSNRTDIEKLIAYKNSERELLRTTKEDKEKRIKEEEEYERLISSPEDINPRDFNYKLLSDIFWKHIGEGTGSLRIGGVEVTKRIARYVSNSGK